MSSETDVLLTQLTCCISVMPRNAPQAECQDRSGRLDFGQVKPGEKISQPISLRYVDAGDHQLRITFYADLVEDPIDRVDLTCTKTTTISISIPFQANNLSRYDPSATPPISLLSAERLKPDFFEKIAQGIFYTRILQNTDIDLTIHNIEYTHTVSFNPSSVSLNLIFFLGRHEFKASPDIVGHLQIPGW